MRNTFNTLVTSNTCAHAVVFFTLALHTMEDDKEDLDTFTNVLRTRHYNVTNTEE